MAPPMRPSSTASASTETTTAPPPNPSARSVAISRVLEETAEYIVLTAPKIAPIPIRKAMIDPSVVISDDTICDCSAK